MTDNSGPRDVAAERVDKVVCRECGGSIDVSQYEMFATAQCPDCGVKLTVPGRLDDFVLLRVMGKGSAGTTYMARDTTLGRDVAIKVLSPELSKDRAMLNAFENEAHALASLNHPNVTQIHAMHTGGERRLPYLVMELVPGGPLDRHFTKDQPMYEQRALEIAVDVAGGLRAAAGIGLIHGDVKPGNILLDNHGTAKLVDFGMARFGGGRISETEAQGTPYYASPEQVRRGETDFRTDMYSLGATLYHVLAGVPPFVGKTVQEVREARLSRPAPDIRTARPDLHEAAAAAIARMLQADPDKRHRSYDDLLADLENALEQLAPGAGKARVAATSVLADEAQTPRTPAEQMREFEPSRPPVPSRLDRIKRLIPSWGASLAIHICLLVVFATITWIVVRQGTRDRVLSLAPVGEDPQGVARPGGRRGGPAERPAPRPATPAKAEMSLPAPPQTESPAETLKDLPAPEISVSIDGPPDTTRSLVDTLAKFTEAGGAGFGSGRGVLAGTSRGFGDEIGKLRGTGLDVVLVIDATDSMSPYIEQAKHRLRRILDVVTGLVPKARFGIVAYKDYGDDYGPKAVKSMKLTSRIADVRKFIDDIVAGGGGDIPEPINEALKAATNAKAMTWTKWRRNVIILVGDSPIHASGRSEAFKAAAAFAAARGTINVIDVGGSGDQGTPRRTVQPDLRKIALSGKGSAFLLKDKDKFWRHLIVSVFGRRFEQDVNIIIEKFAKDKDGAK